MLIRALFVLVVTMLTGCAEENSSGTLTFEGEKFVFRGGGTTAFYDVSDAPGIRIISYLKKTRVQNGLEKEVSELTVSFGGEKNIVLSPSVPVHVLRIKQGSSIRWELK